MKDAVENDRSIEPILTLKYSYPLWLFANLQHENILFETLTVSLRNHQMIHFTENIEFFYLTLRYLIKNYESLRITE